MEEETYTTKANIHTWKVVWCSHNVMALKWKTLSNEAQRCCIHTYKRFCCFHKYQSNTQNWDPYFRLFTFDWAQLRIKTYATHMNTRRKKVWSIKNGILELKIVLLYTHVNKSEFDGSAQHVSPMIRIWNCRILLFVCVCM